MNKNQKIVLIVVGVIMILMLLFPPFTFKLESFEFNSGYAFIFNPPRPPTKEFDKFLACVNVELLFMQWIILISVGAIALVLLKKSEAQKIEQ